jgi:hypothetical protein
LKFSSGSKLREAGFCRYKLMEHGIFYIKMAARLNDKSGSPGDTAFPA